VTGLLLNFIRVGAGRAQVLNGFFDSVFSQAFVAEGRTLEEKALQWMVRLHATDCRSLGLQVFSPPLFLLN